MPPTGERPHPAAGPGGETAGAAAGLTLAPLRRVDITINGHTLTAHPQFTPEARGVFARLQQPLAH